MVKMLLPDVITNVVQQLQKTNVEHVILTQIMIVLKIVMVSGVARHLKIIVAFVFHLKMKLVTKIVMVNLAVMR